TNYCHLYLADNCVLEHEQDLDPHERITVEKMSIQNVKDALRGGTIHHSLVVAAFAQFWLRDA
ncbi:MAG TPA: hypothetical protein VKA08_09925, partial [Balneolales bacterium]|nr:hypothetical protein [Balneolales bacterium]